MLVRLFNALLVLLVFHAVVSLRSVADTPNILLIMVDDLGWMDLACQGNSLVETPNLDRLASQGMRFTNAYAAAPVCSPTRAAVLTGLAPARLQITNHLPDREDFVPIDAKLLPAACRKFLSLEHETFAELLRNTGYANAFVGKWHLAQRGQADHFPEHQGFDVNIGGCSFGGPPTFFDPYRIPTITDRREGEYLPDRLADESIEFIEKHRDGKWMLCLWPYTVHWPMEAPEALLRKYETRTGPGLNDTRYGAMIEAMDTAVGRLLDSLDRMELTQNTLVIFTSDNGGFGGVSDCRPLRESKGYLYEGGIRVPLIVRWPGVVQPATIEDTPVISMDFFPTVVRAAGLELADETPRRMDGTDLYPLLSRTGSLPERDLFFHYPNYAWHKSNRPGSAIRRGRYKLILNYDDHSTELYDLSDDIGESTDLSSEQPGLAASLAERLRHWTTEVGAQMPQRKND